MYSIISLIFLFSFSQAESNRFQQLENIEPAKSSIQKVHTETRTIVADFVEVTQAELFDQPQKSYGKLYFKKENSIRWEHTKPKQQIILIHEDGVRMIESGKEVNNPGTNRMINEIQSLMMQLLSGEFLNEQDFSITYYGNDQQYKLILHPNRRRMSRFIQQLELIFDKETALLESATIVRDESERVTYLFENVLTNTEISNSKFTQF